VKFDVTALLEEKPTEVTESIRKRRMDDKPYWHVERCRIGETRNVPVEIIVNGQVVATREVLADGHIETMTVPIEISQSSWVAVRILPSAHTNPVFVQIDNQPIRASRRSAAWCEEAVQVCWKSKENNIRPGEREAAKAAYDQAAEIYRKIREQATVD
jgi:hypothetical protein